MASKQQKFISHSFGDFLVRDLFQDAHSCLLLAVCSPGRRGPFTGTLIPFLGSPPSRPAHLPKAHLLILSQWGLCFQPMNFQGTHSVSSTHLPIFNCTVQELKYIHMVVKNFLEPLYQSNLKLYIH